MPIRVEQDDCRFLIWLEGEAGLAEAAELKGALIEGLASGRKVCLDLQQAESIDVAIIQLAYAAGREVELRLSNAAEQAFENAGLGRSG